MLPHITTAMKKKFSPSDLAEIIARQTGTENAVAEAFVRKFFEVIEDGLLSDKFVKIKGFGTFKLVSVGERESVNINTGERFQISGHTKVSFTPDTSLKELVNRPFAHFETVDLSDDTDMTEFDEIDKRVAEECQELLDDTDDDDNAADDTNPESNETNVTESSDRMVDSTANHEESSTIQSAKTKMQETSPLPSESGTSSESSATENDEDSTIISISTGTPHSTADEDHATTKEVDSQAVNGEKPTPIIIPHATEASSIQQPTAKTASVKMESEDMNEEETSIETNDSSFIDDKAKASTTHIASSTDTPVDEEEIEVTAPQPVNSAPISGASDNRSNRLSYTYSEVPSRRKHNYWKTATIILCCLIAMLGCYFVGYFRMLCPTCFFSDVEIEQTTPEPEPVPAQRGTDTKAKVAPKQPQSPTTPSDLSAKAPVEKLNQSGTQNQQTEPAPAPTPQQASAATSTTQTKKQTESTALSAQKAEKPTTTYHKVKRGENLTRIVRRHYGSENYVNMVIRHNHLKNANNVVEGMVIELPPLP